MVGMNKQRKFKILVDAGQNPKTVRDRCSGFMRYTMEQAFPWDIRLFSYWEMQDLPTWNRRFLTWHPDGIFVNSTYDAPCIDRLRRIPHIVVFGRPDSGNNMRFPRRTIFVDIDDRQIAEKAFDLLLRRGFSHFAYVHPSAMNENSVRSCIRADAFRRKAEECGCDCAECHKDRCATTDWATSLEALAAELSALPRPCGIMAYNDLCAREVIDACNYAKLHIPEQIQVIGVDNDEDMCENMLPRLTSVEPDFFGTGRLAGQRMEELLAACQPQDHQLCGVSRIVERDTTRDLSGSARLVTAAEKLIHLHACQGLPPSPKGLTVQSLAAALHVSRSLLEMRFNTVRGEGAAAAIRRQKLEEVCRMLKETDLSIGEISVRCGFPVQTHLNALFRRTFGTTLRAYRNSSQTQ